MFKYFNLPFYMDVDDKGGSSGDDKSKDESKQDTPAEIDWSKVDASKIPEDLINKHPAYKKVVDESINRRKKISELNKQIGEPSSSESKEDKVEDKTSANQDQEVPAWAKDIITEFKNMKTTSVNTWRENAGRATGLKGAVLNGLSGNNYDEVLTQAKTIATELGIAPPAIDSSVGNPSQERDKGFMTKVQNRLLNKDASEVFSPDVQRALGGGVTLPD